MADPEPTPTTMRPVPTEVHHETAASDPDLVLTTTDHETAKAIFRLTVAGDSARTGDLAAELAVTPASATARVQRLAERGAASYTPYQGVELTAAGRRVAARVIRRHRIIERLLTDLLEYPWEQADQMAITFEHELPDQVVERLFRALGYPAACPHGFPIPERDANDVPTLPTLDQIEPGVQASVALEGHLADDVRTFLGDLGVRPGAHIVVHRQHPFSGPVEVDVDGNRHTIGNQIARKIHVQP